MSRHAFAWGLAGACLIAGCLRLIGLGQVPPGISADAAIDAWSAACLRAEGTDAFGKPWPIVSTYGFGDHRSALSLYPLAAVQAVAGTNAWSTALPAAIAGVLAVILVGLLGASLLDRSTGLLAAALLAVVPWSLWMGRAGHQAGLVPLLALLPAVFLVLPWTPRAAGLCGALAGLALYGYVALRPFVPAFLLMAALVSWPERWGNRRALAAFAGALALAALPLAWAYLTDPAMSARARELAPWTPDTTWTERASLVGRRFALHFRPSFLFGEGDRWLLHRLPRGGPLPWSLAPALLAGAAYAAARFRTSRGARILLGAALVYPVADVASAHPFGGHLLRSAPGLPWLVLLAAFGVAQALRALASRSRPAAAVAGLVLALGVSAEVGATVAESRSWARRPVTWLAGNADLLEAGPWLRERLPHADAAFLTGRSSGNAGQNWVVWLVAIDADPRAWLREHPRVERVGARDLVVGWGKTTLLMSDRAPAALAALDANGRPDRVLLALRPEESRFSDPAHIVRAPDGTPVLLLFEKVR